MDIDALITNMVYLYYPIGVYLRFIHPPFDLLDTGLFFI